MALTGVLIWGNGSNNFFANILSTPLNELNEQNNLTSVENPFGGEDGLNSSVDDNSAVDSSELEATDIDLEASDIDLEENTNNQTPEIPII